jgi:hypothetical protein
MSSSKTLRAGRRIAAVVVAAVALGRVAGAENIAGPSQVVRLDPGTGQGAFRHLKALQDIAVANGGNRAAGTPGYDRRHRAIRDVGLAGPYRWPQRERR